MTNLSIIIVNYRSAQLIINCLISIYNQPTSVPFEVLVVDNQSQDNSQTMINSVFPQVKWVQMGYNAGFARANNAGIRQSSGQAILLLNPDTLIEANAIERCYQSFITSDYVACGVQLLNPDRTPQISGNYAVQGGINYLLPLPYVGSSLKYIAHIFNVKKPHIAEAKEITEVDWINGAFLMVKNEGVKKVGLLDEDFFLYAEEAEWCSRLKKVGKLCIYGDLHVIHLQGETANETFDSSGKGYFNLFDKKGLQIMLSNFVRIRKEFGVSWFLFDLLIYLFTIPIFLFGIFFAKIIFWNKNKYTFAQWWGFSKNVGKMITLSGKIIKNKPYFYKVL